MHDPPATIVETLPHCHPQEFPNLSKAFTALSSNQYSNYREVFQCTKKTYLRSTMKEDRLNGLSLVHIHKHDESFSAEDIVDDFAASENRRKELLFQLFGLTLNRCRKAIFYCGTEINILKFRYLLQIQLTAHTINSLEGLICPLYYRPP